MVRTDPIADFITIIRNGVMARKEWVLTENSRILREIAKILKREGYIADWEVVPDERRHAMKGGTRLKIHLKYVDPERRKSPLQGIRRVSKPGRRIYAGADEIPSTLNGLGITILTTSKGLKTDREARREHIGGEIMIQVW